MRYDTTFRFTDEQRLLTYEAGDLVTGALPWSTSVRIGGVQLSRDFGARPDLVTYPLPAFAGEAAVPTSLDLFINGYKSSTTELQPGPYTLTNVPFINGAGEAVVVTTDALGRQVSTTLPFYVTSSLLPEGPDRLLGGRRQPAPRLRRARFQLWAGRRLGQPALWAQ
jgi:outer membrane usher protein